MIFATRKFSTSRVLVHCILLGSIAHGKSWVTASRESCTQPRETSISYRGDGYKVLPEIYNTLASCPNISSLELDFTREGCVMRSQPWRFSFRAGDRFPPLKKLILLNFDFENKDHPWHHDENSLYRTGRVWVYNAREWIATVVPSLKQDFPSPKAATLDHWRHAMDFTQLEELELTEDDYFFSEMGNEFPGLRRLTIHAAHSHSLNLEPFLTALPALESLSFHATWPYFAWKSGFSLDNVIDHHGASLHSLELHKGDQVSQEQEKVTLSPAKIASIGARCPHLDHLGLDIGFNGTWPNATLDALVGIPQLSSLSIGLPMTTDLTYYELGQIPIDAPSFGRDVYLPSQRMTLNKPEALFADLRTKKQGSELRQLNITLDGYTEKPCMGPDVLEDWGSDFPRKYVCDSTGVSGNEKPPLCRVLASADTPEWFRPD